MWNFYFNIFVPLFWPGCNLQLPLPPPILTPYSFPGFQTLFSTCEFYWLIWFFKENHAWVGWPIDFSGGQVFFKKEYFITNSMFFEKKVKKRFFFYKDASKIGTTTYNMKVCLSFFYFDIFNIAKFH